MNDRTFHEKQSASVFSFCRRVICYCLCVAYLVQVNANATEYKVEYQSYIEEVCEEYGICPELVEAIIFYESSWKEDVVSSSGCVGLMQINKKVHTERIKKLGVTDLKDGRQNIRVGVDILYTLFCQYEDVEVVLDAYNGNKRKEDWYVRNRSSYAKRVLNLSRELEEKHKKIGG